MKKGKTTKPYKKRGFWILNWQGLNCFPEELKLLGCSAGWDSPVLPPGTRDNWFSHVLSVAWMPPVNWASSTTTPGWIQDPGGSIHGHVIAYCCWALYLKNQSLLAQDLCFLQSHIKRWLNAESCKIFILGIISYLSHCLSSRLWAYFMLMYCLITFLPDSAQFSTKLCVLVM